jgi:hypothetical protein
MPPRVCRFVLWAGVLGAGLLPVCTARAYVVQGGKWPQPGGKGTDVTITYSYNNLLDSLLLQPSGEPLSPNFIRGSIEEALGLWASVAPLHFVEVEDEGGGPYQSSYPNGQFGQIRFNAIHINGPDPVVGQPVAKAMAYYPSAGGNLGGDVFFDYDDRWQPIGTLSIPDVLGAAVHELGHTLGLGHSTVQQSGVFWQWQEYNTSGDIVDVTEAKGATVMYWVFERFDGPGTGHLFQDDINGIRAIYGTGVGSVTPLATGNVPEPASWMLMALAALGWRAFATRGHAPKRAG